ncbi:serine/threonine-protein kinase [Hyalangium gracile]|uniref:serine/threonine-protein kinase n=1 Tax=Hyalangium gracile TaxID=394092 RepID=UPI001CCC0900|nr:serine/threonine-protein kinase [Hyalangium gracile]
MNTSPSSARLRPFRPQPFGRYTLLSHLATGGMGEIYLARLEGAQGFEKLCVIKKILPQLAEDKEFVDRFVGEARTLVKLQHGSIAQVLDMGLHEGDAYMALEYVDGKDLRKVAGRVRDKGVPLPLTFVLFVMGRVLDALAYAHRKRDDDEKEIHLVHRDISPQNILISYEGEVKVIDFGLAKSRLSAAKTNPSIILGKFLYMSPEQAKHQQVDRRSDLYAVGLCLYELIAGKNPFDSVHSGELMSAVANPRIVPLLEVEPFTPPPVAQLVMKALAVEPAQRFQTAEEFRGKLVSVLMEIDPSAGPESVSRFMRDLFAAEFQGERKLLAQLKEVSKTGELPPRSELDTDPGARFPVPSLPPKTIKLDPPTQPLSFQPTPRSRPGASVHDEETRPGVAVAETRPAVSFEALDAAARARVRPSLSSTSPTTDTVTVEVRTDPHERTPPLPVGTAAPSSPRTSAPTLEVAIPYVPAAAVPPGVAPPAQTAGTARTLEAPKVPPPPASSPSLKALEPARAAVPPPPPSGGAPAPRSGEVPRAGAPSAPGTGSFKAVEAQRAPMPPPSPASAHAHEPRGPDVARSQALTLQNLATVGTPEAQGPGSASAMPPPPPASLTPPDAHPMREPAPPPVPDEEPPSEAPPASSREWSRGSASSRAAQSDMGEAPVWAMDPAQQLSAEGEDERPDPSRRGLDDTHPSYLMASSKPPEDTQPRVVLDEDAFRAHQEAEEQVIINGVLEEPTPARPKAPRRTRASATGMPSVSRPHLRAQRPVEREEQEDASAEQEDSGPVVIEIEDGGADAPRDPRDDTRKTPIPTRPGESSRRAQREDARRGAAPEPARKRSWAWVLVSFLLLVVAGAAVVVALPQLQHALKLTDDAPPKPAPATPIPRVEPPSGPPGMAPAAANPTPIVPPAPVAAPPANDAAKAAAAPSTPPPAETASPEAAVEDDFFVPLPDAPPPPAKKANTRPSKKGPRSREATELQKDWSAVRSLYGKFTQDQPCESSRIAIFCPRYEEAKESMNELGDEYSQSLHKEVRTLRRLFEQKRN